MRPAHPFHDPVLIGALLLLIPTGTVSAQSISSGLSLGNELLRQYAGSDDTDSLLRHRDVRPQLLRLLGSELAHLENNLFVRGSVDVVSGALALQGNEPHLGTEEEAVVCIATYDLQVSAAIFSKGKIAVYSRDGSYDNLPRCIKDWITVVNSARVDRMVQPRNVQMFSAPAQVNAPDVSKGGAR